MSTFQFIVLALIVLWFVLVVFRFQRSSVVLIGGLLGIGLVTLAAFASGKVTLDELGLGSSHPWWSTLGFALGGLGLMLAASPLADRLATRWVHAPPTLEAFSMIQQSKSRLVAGILAAWLLGGVLEELLARGIVLKSVESILTIWLMPPLAAGLAVILAAIGAGLIHSYQGHRAVLIITQLSILLGVLFVLSGYNLWPVMLCHGMYDTIGFVRYAAKKSKYSDLDHL